MDYGIRPVVVEPMPNCLHDHIKAGDAMRDECIDKVITMLAVMDELDVRTICFNFMAHVGWTRTSNMLPERGGAKVTGFRLADYVQGLRASPRRSCGITTPISSRPFCPKPKKARDKARPCIRTILPCKARRCIAHYDIGGQHGKGRARYCGQPKPRPPLSARRRIT